MPTHKGGKKGKDRKSYRNKQSGRYERQRFRTERNKRKRRRAHLLKHPNDAQNKRILTPLV